jgi:2-oxoglutarate ferredoxin oxidoreductase subunit delta
MLAGNIRIVITRRLQRQSQGVRTMKVYGRTPLDVDQARIPTGQVYIIPERCKGCAICVQFCPQQVLQVSDLTNAKGYHYPEIAPGKEDACIHCEFCTMICPEFAIFTLEAEQ